MWIVLIGLLLTLGLGVPLAFSFGFGTELSVIFAHLRESIILPTIFHTVDSFTLMAIPFFILAGELMKVGGISRQIVNFAELLVGKIKAGLCYVMIIACAFFGAISGSSVACVSAIGSVMVPLMKEKKYNGPVTASLLAASGFIGILIPPSIPMVVYSVLAGISISKAFLSTVIPGIMLALSYALLIKFYYVRKGFFDETVQEFTNTAEVKKAFAKTFTGAIPALVMPLIILGGIYSGAFTPTEAAAVAVIYSVIVGSAVYKGLTAKNIKGTLAQAAMNAGAIMFVMAFVKIFGTALMLEGIPEKIANAILSVTDNKFILLLLINLFLLLVGMFIEENSAILILTPIMLPLIQGIGVDPMQFGALIVMNLGVGLITPPHASNLFVANKVTKTPILDMLPHILRFIFFAAIPCVLLITYIPALTLWLPSLAK